MMETKGYFVAVGMSRDFRLVLPQIVHAWLPSRVLGVIAQLARLALRWMEYTIWMSQMQVFQLSAGILAYS